MNAISTFYVSRIREDFPVLDQMVNGKALVYFDNAATSQKPKKVIKALSDYYLNDNANIHRGIHSLAERATANYEATRKSVASFINASEEEVIFTRGTTEGINLVAQAYGLKFIQKGDHIIISELEHHSNIVPWQILCEKTGAHLKVIRINEKGELDLEHFQELLSERTAFVSVNYISNSLGTINPVKRIVELSHEHEAKVLIDAAQASHHQQIDVKDLNVDFLAFSSHKMYGPTGVGILYGKRRLLEEMDPYQSGGEMIREVSFEKTTYNEIPYKFEAGTPNIGDVIAFSKAIEFITDIGFDNIQEHENNLLQASTDLLSNVPGFVPYGTAAIKTSVISFNIENIHPFDLGQMLDAKGIAVRTGHHCTQPLMTKFGIEGTVRASYAVYNTLEEVTYFVENLYEIVKRLTR